MKSRFLRAYRSAENFILERSASRPFFFLSILFALVDMRREASSVVSGRISTSAQSTAALITLLRRDVHRVEKGLIMRPRRIPFGREYLPTLVSTFVLLKQQNTLPKEELAWTSDVLSEYFRVTADQTEKWLVAARGAFNASISNVPGTSTLLNVPLERKFAPASQVTLEGLESLALRRRSVRWYTSDAMDPLVIERAIAIGAQAPSACNRQSFRFHIVYGQSASKDVLDTVGGTRGFSGQVPCVAILIGSESGYRHTFDRHAIFVDGGLAAMGFLYGLEVQGVSSCCVNWPDTASRYNALRNFVDIGVDEQVIMLIAIGNADQDGMVPSSVKRGIDTLRTM